jgi:hypothetical protein
MAVVNGDLITGDERGNITRFKGLGPAVSWRFRNGARISTLLATEKGILAASLDNFVYLISSYNGDTRWKKRMPGRVSNIVERTEIVFVETVGEPTAFLLNLNDGKSAGQAASPDGGEFTQPPVTAQDKMVFFTSSTIWASSFGPCSPI